MDDILIIGLGPAGCAAAIFAARRNMKTLVVNDPGELSQAEMATIVDDWPGEPGISGVELVEKLRGHVKKLGVRVVEDKITDIRTGKASVKVKGKKEYEARTVIFATGAKHRKGMIKGEDEFSGRGVSYCASCDAPLFRGKKVLVLGGGDSAIAYAILLDQVGADTIIVHRRDEFRAAEALQNSLKKSGVKILLDTVCLEIKGGKEVSSAVLLNKKTGKKEEVKVGGVFVAFGNVPTSELARRAGAKLDKDGYIEVDRNQRTSVERIFAAGDCCSNPSKKIITASGDGAIAAESAYRFLKE